MRVTLILLSMFAVVGCKKSDSYDYDGCERDHAWRDALDVSTGSALAIITTGCNYELEVTRAEMNGIAFSSEELPEVGDIINTTEWAIQIDFNLSDSIDVAGEYTGVLYIEAEGLREDSAPLELFAVVTEEDLE